ncbi:DNA-binding IclR family transcriptional regulator [Mycobacterium sp. AZCC_0083]|nr:DNA-binding IclR family transcriptional regulator [Mycobacterium sp. AZCC_0083]
MDLAAATGIPRPTVYRLLQQLVTVGAIRRDGTRYRLGATPLGLGARAMSERRLRVVARRPLAELSAATGAAVCLSATIEGGGVFLDMVDARVPLGYSVEPGDRVPPGTAQDLAHSETSDATPIIDASKVIEGISCVAVPIPLGGGAVAAVSTIVAAIEPPSALLSATRLTAARISGLLMTAKSLLSGR